MMIEEEEDGDDAFDLSQAEQLGGQRRRRRVRKGCRADRGQLHESSTGETNYCKSNGYVKELVHYIQVGL
jgi:hypothetical protein